MYHRAGGIGRVGAEGRGEAVLGRWVGWEKWSLSILEGVGKWTMRREGHGDAGF